jgi:hypothetical protein
MTPKQTLLDQNIYKIGTDRIIYTDAEIYAQRMKYWQTYINLLKPSGNFTYHQV